MYNNLLIRCSSIYKIMTPPKDKTAGKLGATHTTYLKELHKEHKYSRKKEYGSKYIEKGLKVEEDAITLLGLHLKEQNLYKGMLRKNTQRITNGYITGEPDVILWDNPQRADQGFDTKASWDVFTFPDVVADIKEELTKQYDWQNLGYMALTGATKWTTAYCLVNATPELIMREKKSLYFAMDCPSDTDEEYLAKCIEIEKNMIFDMQLFKTHYPGFDIECKDWKYDIPASERVKLFTTVRDESKIESIYTQVQKSRDWLNERYGEKESVILASQDEHGTVIIEPCVR